MFWAIIIAMIFVIYIFLIGVITIAILGEKDERREMRDGTEPGHGEMDATWGDFPPS